MYKARLRKIRTKNHRPQDMKRQNAQVEFSYNPTEGEPFNCCFIAEEIPLLLNAMLNAKEGKDYEDDVSGAFRTSIVTEVREFHIKQNEYCSHHTNEVHEIFFWTSNTLYHLYDVVLAT